MGKSVLLSVNARISNAIQQARDDGYLPHSMAWYLSKDGFIPFSCHPTYYAIMPHYKTVYNYSYPPDAIGNFDGAWVYLDDSLHGAIAELRAIAGEPYVITLDFSTE